MRRAAVALLALSSVTCGEALVADGTTGDADPGTSDQASTGSTAETSDARTDASGSTGEAGDESTAAESTGAVACTALEPVYGRVDVGEVELDVAQFGCGHPLVFLHGFPEFSFSWEAITLPLASEYSIVAPDQRGYNGSDIPPEEQAYHVDALVGDVAGLIEQTTSEPPILVAHDWGGAIAWVFAHRYPERIAGLVILNGPHPDVFTQQVATNPAQLAAVQYMNAFMSPTAEAFLSADDYAPMMLLFGDSLSAEDEQRYLEAYAVDGALTGMLSWYRANLELGPVLAPDWPKNVTIDVPTLVMWGMQDVALLPGNLDGLDAHVADLEVVEVEDATHWIMHDQPERVVEELRAFAAARWE